MNCYNIDICYYYYYYYYLLLLFIIIIHYHLLGERNFSFTLVGTQDDLLFESGSEMSIKGLHLLGFE